MLIKCDGNLTGHVQLSSCKPLDLASAQITVLDHVERTDPAQSLTRRSGPEALTVGDGKLLQRRAVRHTVKTRSFRHKGRKITSPSAENVEIRPEEPATQGHDDAL